MDATRNDVFQEHLKLGTRKRVVQCDTALGLHIGGLHVSLILGAVFLRIVMCLALGMFWGNGECTRYWYVSEVEGWLEVEIPLRCRSIGFCN